MVHIVVRNSAAGLSCQYFETFASDKTFLPWPFCYCQRGSMWFPFKMRSSLNLATKPKESFQSHFQEPIHVFLRHTHTRGGNIHDNYIFSSQNISLSYKQFFNLKSWAYFGKQKHTVLGWWDREVIVYVGAFYSTIESVHLSWASWMFFALGWSIRLSLLLLTNEMHDIYSTVDNNNFNWLGVQTAGQQQACMSMSTSLWSEHYGWWMMLAALFLQTEAERRIWAALACWMIYNMSYRGFWDPL